MNYPDPLLSQQTVYPVEASHASDAKSIEMKEL